MSSLKNLKMTIGQSIKKFFEDGVAVRVTHSEDSAGGGGVIATLHGKQLTSEN